MLTDCYSLNRSTFSWKQEKVGLFMLLRDVLKEYKFDCKARKLSVKTIDGYVRMNGYLFDYLEQKHGIYDVEQVRASHIKQFLLRWFPSLVRMQPVLPATVGCTRAGCTVLRQ